METKKIQQAPHKHNHTIHQILRGLQYRGKNHKTASKNIHYEIEITSIKFINTKLESTINWIYNK